MKKDIDAQFLCKDCERYNLCKYYDKRKKDSYICKYFHLPDKLDKIKAEIERKCCITVRSDNEPAITLYDVFQILDKYKAESEEAKVAYSIPIEPYKVNANINDLPEMENDPIGEEIERQFKIRAAKAEKTIFPLHADGELVAESEQMSKEDFLNLCRTAVDDSGQQN